MKKIRTNDKVLVVAYHFPPDADVGAIRPQKFVKYLPQFGWEPHVLTIREKFFDRIDRGRLADVEGIDIVRTDFWRTPLRFYFDTRDQFRKIKSPGSPVQVPGTETSARQGDGESLKARLKQYLWELSILPDEQMFWLLPAVASGYRLARRERVPFIFATIPPPTAALVGYFLALMTGARLILDFRDPWVGARFPGERRSRPYDKLEAALERLTVDKADRVITTTDRFKDQLKRNYPDQPEEKFISIPNGFDGDDIVSEGGPQKSPRFVVSYMGNFYQKRNPEIFFQALKAGINGGYLPSQGMEVRFMGYVEFIGNRSIRDLLRGHGLENVVRVLGQVPYHEALIHMQTSDLLLLFAPDQPNQIPGKTFEYISVRKPILALTEEGATADLVRSVNGGLIVRQDDLNGILDALKEFYRQYLAGESPWYRGIDVSQYARLNLTEKLAGLLETPV